MTIKEQAHFAAYFNMARRNAYETLKHISLLSGIAPGKENAEESQMAQMKVITTLTAKSRNEEKVRISNLLYKHFRFLKPILGEKRIKDNKRDENNKRAASDFNTLADVMTDICKVLNYYRDKYSHYQFNDPRTNSNEYRQCEMRVVRLLTYLFSASVREIKKRYNLTTELNFLNLYKTKRGENGTREVIIDTRHSFALQKDNGMLSRKGLIFLVCQFIDKKYATMLFDQQGYRGYGFYGNNNEARCRYIREVFSAYRMQRLNERMNVERNDIALAMDMLNELRRCPKELFDIISPDEQNKFRIKSDKTGEEVLLRRSSDRFALLAMQYIDCTGAFDRIRFQVSLGKYRYEFYDKTCIDGESHLRILQKDLNGFGRLNDIDHAREERWGDLIRKWDEVECDTRDSKPYITDHHAQYIINGNNIGMYFNGNDHNALRNGMYLPAIDNENAPCIQPVCRMSTYELPALIFYHLLASEQGSDNQIKSAEQIIIDCVANYSRLFNDIANGELSRSGNAESDFAHICEQYHIERNDLPRELQDYITGKQRQGFEPLARKQIIEMIVENNAILKSFREKKNKALATDVRYGKRQYREILPGRLAAFLAQDIVDMMPIHSKKPTGKNFSVLQSMLATLDTRYNPNALDDLEQLLVDMNALIPEGGNAQDYHPFLDAIFEYEYKDTIEFYEHYMQLRGNYLRGILESKNYKQAPFLHAGRKRWEERNDHFYRDLAGRYAGQPIDLPRGLFNKFIKEILAQYPTLSQALQQEQCNTTYLIAQYMQLVRNDDSQPYYNAPRHYSCLSGKGEYLTTDHRNALIYSKDRSKSQLYRTALDKYLRQKRRDNRTQLTQKQREEYTAAFKRIWNEMNDTEQTLRRYRVQDMLLYMAACNIIKGKMNAAFPHRLCMIADESDTPFFEYKMPLFTTDITLSDGRKCTLKQRDLKLKNYGDFFRFLYDARTTSLLKAGNITEIERDMLENELDNYDGCRHEVFEVIFEIEKYVIEANPQLNGKRIDFKDVLNVMTGTSEAKKEILRIIRNGFSHNFYPKVDDIDYNNLPNVARSLKECVDKYMQ